MAKKQVQRPNRDPDHYSKRGVAYFWSPDWIRGTSADVINDKPLPGDIILSDGRGITPCKSYGRIHAIKEVNTVNLYMKSKEGNLTFIQGSIQEEFKRWHTDRSIDYLLFGLDPDELLANDD